jgi:hypothetical protein
VLNVEQPVTRRVVGALDGSADPLAVTGEYASQKCRQRYRLIGTPTIYFPLLRRPVNGAGEVVVIEYADVGNAYDLPQPLLAFAKRLCRLFAFGDVPEDSLQDFFLLDGDHLRQDLDGHFRAIGTDNGIFNRM